MFNNVTPRTSSADRWSRFTNCCPWNVKIPKPDATASPAHPAISRNRGSRAISKDRRVTVLAWRLIQTKADLSAPPEVPLAPADWKALRLDWKHRLSRIGLPTSRDGVPAHRSAASTCDLRRQLHQKIPRSNTSNPWKMKDTTLVSVGDIPGYQNKKMMIVSYHLDYFNTMYELYNRCFRISAFKLIKFFLFYSIIIYNLNSRKPTQISHSKQVTNPIISSYLLISYKPVCENSWKDSTSLSLSSPYTARVSALFF